MANKVLARGVDVSTWQGTNIDWSKVKSAGYGFAILRIGYGKYSSQKDNTFDVNYKNTKAVGMPIGVYHYSYAKTVAEAEQEAKVCIEWMKGKQFEYPIFYDVEDNSIAYLGKRLTTDIVKKFLDTVAAAGYWVGLYTNPNWLENKLYADELVNKYDIWLAMWSSYDTYSRPHTMWQYSEKGIVPGISGYTDMDVSYFDYPTAIKNAGKNGYKAGTVTPTPTPVKPTDPNECQIINSKVVMRADSCTDAKSIATLSVGTKVIWQADDRNGWSKVKYVNKSGWVPNVNLSRKNTSTYPIGTCNGYAVNVRTGPSTKYKSLMQMNKGKKFTVVCIRNDGWLDIIIDGKAGYVFYNRSYISVAWK